MTLITVWGGNRQHNEINFVCSSRGRNKTDDFIWKFKEMNQFSRVTANI